jgi:hypothetical protein
MALVIPKAVMNERIAVFEATPNSSSANCGKIVLSIPMMPPTNAFTMTRRVNCFQFSVRPSLILSVAINFIEGYNDQ